MEHLEDSSDEERANTPVENAYDSDDEERSGPPGGHDILLDLMMPCSQARKTPLAEKLFQRSLCTLTASLRGERQCQRPNF